MVAFKFHSGTLPSQSRLHIIRTFEPELLNNPLDGGLRTVPIVWPIRCPYVGLAIRIRAYLLHSFCFHNSIVMTGAPTDE